MAEQNTSEWCKIKIMEMSCIAKSVWKQRGITKWWVRSPSSEVFNMLLSFNKQVFKKRPTCVYMLFTHRSTGLMLISLELVHSWSWDSKFSGCGSHRTHYSIVQDESLLHGYSQVFCRVYGHDRWSEAGGLRSGCLNVGVGHFFSLELLMNGLHIGINGR